MTMFDFFSLSGQIPGRADVIRGGADGVLQRCVSAREYSVGAEGR